MKYILDDEDRIRLVGLYDEGYCNHGISLDDLCKECESETVDIDNE